MTLENELCGEETYNEHTMVLLAEHGESGRIKLYKFAS